jgi:hypothetical protein
LIHGRAVIMSHHAPATLALSRQATLEAADG